MHYFEGDEKKTNTHEQLEPHLQGYFFHCLNFIARQRTWAFASLLPLCCQCQAIHHLLQTWRPCFSAMVYCSFHSFGCCDLRGGRVSFVATVSTAMASYLPLSHSHKWWWINSFVLIVRVKLLSTLLKYGTLPNVKLLTLSAMVLLIGFYDWLDTINKLW